MLKRKIEIKPFAIYNVQEVSDILSVEKDEVLKLFKNRNGIVARDIGGFKVLGQSIINYLSDWLHRDK